MWKTRSLFITIIVAVILAPHAVARDKFSISVYDKNGNLAPDVSIEIWNGIDRVDSGYTNSEGKYESWLDSDIRYRITANINEQFGEWNGYPDINNRYIKIEMRVRGS